MKCYKCNKQFDNIIIKTNDLKKHLLKIKKKKCKMHVWNKKNICKHCNISFSSKTTFCYHKENYLYNNSPMCIIL